MRKMYSCHYIVMIKDGEGERRAKFVGEAIQAKSWEHAQEIADCRGKGEIVDGIYG